MTSAGVAVNVVRMVCYLPDWLCRAIDGDIGSNGITRSDVMRRGLERIYAKKRPNVVA